MDLNDLKFDPITPPPPKRADPSFPCRVSDQEKTPVKDGEVIEEPFPEGVKPTCSKCEIDGAFVLDNNTCSVCGAVWEEADDSDGSEFEIALELLESCSRMFDIILNHRKALNKLGHHDENKLRDLALSVADFTETYEWQDVNGRE